MAAVPVSSLSVAESQELMVSYAALILADAEAEITADKLAKIVAAAGGKVESYLPALFARFLATAKMSDLLASVGSGAGAAAPAAAAAAAPAAAAAAAPAPKEEEEAPIEFDLF
eukprot:GDKJ01005441.1.p1 GENE.GDKJ01005441.1~~GDKJ01005441.1.p1  ORF type:complete len:114 (+),score=50.71 GDKJ01005441.1:56-397(+)